MHRELLSDPFGPGVEPGMIRPRPVQSDFQPIFGTARVASSPASLDETQASLPRQLVRHQVRHLPPFAISTRRLSLPQSPIQSLIQPSIQSGPAGEDVRHSA